MSNDIFSAVVEDQGEVLLELTSRALSGARVNALSLPYFRGTGAGVLSDENSSWWQNSEALYQAGGGYFTFPDTTGNGINSIDTSWILRRYGTEQFSNSVWRLSEMKSREEGKRFKLTKIDMILPRQPVLYTAVKMENTGESDITATCSWHSMLGYPAVSTGTIINSNARFWTSYGMSSREAGLSRFAPGSVFEDLKHAPLLRGGVADAGVVPPPTGTYDYFIGKIPEKEALSWVSVNNPHNQLMYFMATPHKPASPDEFVFPNVDLAQNYFGRMDAPWALFDGATPEVFALTLGFNTGPRGTKNMVLRKGESKVAYIANGFMAYENPRIGLGVFSTECTAQGVVFKRTKSSAVMPMDTSFRAIRMLAKRLFSPEEEE